MKFVSQKCGTFFYLKINNRIMPKISMKGLRMPESPIRKLVPFAEEAKKRYGDICRWFVKGFQKSSKGKPL